MLFDAVVVLTLLLIGTHSRQGFATRQSSALLPGRRRIIAPDPADSRAGLIEPTATRRRPADFLDGDDVGIRSHWALLIAGSAGWGNYRHQADVCHAYQVLRQGGFHPQHMVLMMYDDIADNLENPHKGHIFNRPGGPDVYAGLAHVIDYRGTDVNAANFLAVLGGDAEAVRNIGTGRVIGAGKDDRLFVVYSDHGAPGVLGMPSGNFLFADDLMETIRRRHAAHGYRELVMYVEACESGSMFEGLLNDDLAAYVTTASNAVESSWGTYCPGMDPQPPEEFTTCLGDLYSVAWMENSEVSDLTVETLLDQYTLVTARTSNNFTYNMGSHVMQYGSLAINKEKAGDYIGMKHNGLGFLEDPLCSAKCSIASNAAGLSQEPLLQRATPKRHQAVPQREADLVPLRQRRLRAQGAEQQAAAQAELDRAVRKRQSVDAAAEEATASLLLSASTSNLLVASMGLSPLLLHTLPPSSARSVAAPLVNLLMSEPLGRPARGKPLVDSWQCLKDMVEVWNQLCGRMDDYSMRHTRLLANLCNAGVAPEGLRGALQISPSCSL